MTQLKVNQQTLASYLLAEIETFAEVDDDRLRGHDGYVRAMLTTGIPFTPTTWIGEYSPRRKMQWIRVARELEAAGSLERITEPSRDCTTHLIPTGALLCQTIVRLGGHVDSDAVLEGLLRTAWGQSIAADLRLKLDDRKQPIANATKTS